MREQNKQKKSLNYKLFTIQEEAFNAAPAQLLTLESEHMQTSFYNQEEQHKSPLFFLYYVVYVYNSSREITLW